LNIFVGIEGREARDVEVIDEAYGAPVRRFRVEPGSPSTLAIDMARTHGWYDFAIRVAGLVYRYAGRIETGKWSITDPAMGEKA
jgi:phospholipase C